MTVKNLNFQTLKSEVVNFQIPPNDSYIESYPEFLRYFENISLIEKHHLIISSHFVYGWMPTILNLETKEIDRALFLLNAVKAGYLLDLEEIKTLKKCINNSLVGLSKLLHYINPGNYAIWDSRIFRYLTGKKSAYGIDQPELYLQYLLGLNEICENKNYVELHSMIERKFDYQLTPMRAIEILMFETDRVRQSYLKNVIENTNVNYEVDSVR